MVVPTGNPVCAPPGPFRGSITDRSTARLTRRGCHGPRPGRSSPLPSVPLQPPPRPPAPPSGSLDRLSTVGTLFSFWGVRQDWWKANLVGTAAKRVRTRWDSGPGHSGGPFYYPSGCCGSYYGTGVLAGHVDLWGGPANTGGPKGSAIRSWVIANMRPTDSPPSLRALSRAGGGALVACSRLRGILGCPP